MIVIISGPQGCGKTRHAPQLLRHFGGKRIVEFDGIEFIAEARDGDVVLTNLTPRAALAAVKHAPGIKVVAYLYKGIKNELTGGDHGLRK